MVERLLRALGTVFRAGLTTLIDAESIECTTHDVVTNTWKVFHSATANEHDGVLLEVVTFTTDVGDDFEAIGQAHLGDLTESGVWLLWRPGHDLEADAPTLGAVGESRRLRLLYWHVASFADELVNSRHVILRVIELPDGDFFGALIGKRSGALLVHP